MSSYPGHGGWQTRISVCFFFSSQSQDFKFIIFVSGRVINHHQLILLLFIFLSLVYAMCLSSSFICYFQGQASSYMLIFFYFQDMMLSCLMTLAVMWNQKCALRTFAWEKLNKHFQKDINITRAMKKVPKMREEN